MDVDIRVNPIEGGRFRASYPLLDLVAEADTRASAIADLRAAIDRCLADGIEIVAIPISINKNRNLECFGTMKDDAMHQQWLAIIAENRRRADFEEGIILEPTEVRAGA